MTRSRFTLAILLAILAVPSFARGQGANVETVHAALDPDVVLVQRTIWVVNAQLPGARNAIDRATLVEFRSLIWMAVAGAGDAEILAFGLTAPIRLDAAAAPFVDRAHQAVDAATAILRLRHGSVPSPFSESLGGAILTFDGQVLVRARQRWAAIDSLVAWLTR